jgi:3-oxoadipate enol-lactonase
MAEIIVGGEAFNVLVEGDEGKEVLMISNPLGVNLRLWDSQMPELLEHFRIVRFDSRGHGASVANEGPYSIAGFGRDALAIMDALDIEKAHWLGLSLGAFVGQWLLVHAPQRVGRAVLASTAAQMPGPELWNERIQTARKTGMAGVAEIVAERWFTKGFRENHRDAVETVMAMLRETPLQGYTAACAAIRDMDQREDIRSITNKVLVIAGRHDTSTPPGNGALVASSIEGAKLATLEASHLSIIEDAENFVKAAIDFLIAVDSPARKAFPRRRSAARQPPSHITPAQIIPAKTAPVGKANGKKASAQAAPAKKAPAAKASPPKTFPAKTPVAKALALKVPAAKVPAAKAPVAKAVPAKAASAKKSPAWAAPTKKAAVKKSTVKKATVKKAPAKKVTAKIVAAKKAPVKKAIAEQAPAKKIATKKPPVQQASVKKAPVKKTLAKKPEINSAPVRKTVAAKLPTKKAAAKKAAAKPITSKTTAAKKAVAKKAPIKKTT